MATLSYNGQSRVDCGAEQTCFLSVRQIEKRRQLAYDSVCAPRCSAVMERTSGRKENQQERSRSNSLNSNESKRARMETQDAYDETVSTSSKRAVAVCRKPKTNPFCIHQQIRWTNQASLSKGSILMGVCHRPFVYHSLRSQQFNQVTDDDEVCVCLFHFLRMKCDNLTIQFMTWRTSFRGIFGSGMPNAYWHTVQILFPPAFWNVFLLPLWMLRTLGWQKLFSTWFMIVFF